MMAALSVSESFAQPAISGRVRRQPRQKPLAPSTAQTFTQGVTIGLGGVAGVLILSNIVALTSVRKRRAEGYPKGLL